MNIFPPKNYLFFPRGKQFLQKLVIVHKEMYVSEFTHLHAIYCFNLLLETDLCDAYLTGMLFGNDLGPLLWAQGSWTIGKCALTTRLQPTTRMVLLTAASLWGAMARSTVSKTHEPKEDTNLEGKCRNTVPIFFLYSLPFLTRGLDSWQTPFYGSGSKWFAFMKGIACGQGSSLPTNVCAPVLRSPQITS